MKILLALFLASLPALAAPSFTILPTGNGFGFALFDTTAARPIAFLDHPYRFERPAADERANGIERRNLLEELRFAGEAGGSTEYLAQSNIVHVRQAQADRYYFEPFGLELNALVAGIQLRDGQAVGQARLKFHLGAHPVSPNFWDSTLEIVKIPGERLTRVGRAWLLRGKGEGAILYVPLQNGASGTCDAGHCRAAETGLTLRGPVAADQSFGVLVAYLESSAEVPAALARIESWVAGRSLTRLVADSLRDWESWRKPAPPGVTAAERPLWRQSEAVLRMGQVREPNVAGVRASHGMMLASLAPGGWATGWVRDGTYATVALARTGHFREARDSLDFFLNAAPVGRFKRYVRNYDYRISVTRYFGSGEEEADYSEQSTPNVETDGWGLYLWAARQYVDSSGDTGWLRAPTRRGSVYEAMRDGVAGAIASQLERSGVMSPDSSIWEVHQENARHFAFTTLAAARGLCDFASLASRAGEKADHDRFAALATRVRDAFAPFFTAPEGYLVGAKERTKATDLDGSVIEAFNLGVLGDARSPVALSSITHLEGLRLPEGGFSRVGGTSTYETNEWPFIDLRMAGAYLRVGRRLDALPLIERVTEQARENYWIVPEMYDPRANFAYSGAIPMVGYGSGAYELALLDREGITAQESCD